MCIININANIFGNNAMKMSYVCKYIDKKYEKIVKQSRQIQLNQVLNN